MDDKDKILVQESKEIVADSVVDEVAKSLPGFSVVWGLCKALHGAGLKLRQQRALEWVELVRDNPSVFTRELVKTEGFQDGFVYSLQKYIVERNEDKRRIMKNIFLDFSQCEDKNDYPLERHYHTLSQLSEDDIKVLRDVDLSKTRDSNYQIYGSNPEGLGSIFNLGQMGILLLDTAPRVGMTEVPFVKVTSYGVQFVQFLKD